VYEGEGVREEEENSGKKRTEEWEGRGERKRNACYKDPIGSFLRSLAAAKF